MSGPQCASPHSDPMDAVKLAEHIGCIVRPADALVDIARLEELNRIQDDAFFACTFELPENRHAIVFNPLMSHTRRNSDIAHEVAHIVLGHRLSRLERLGTVAFLSCDKQQEEEAAWLSGCLLLPRFALIHDLMRKRRKPSTIAKHRVLSNDLVDYRVRVTGGSTTSRCRRPQTCIPKMNCLDCLCDVVRSAWFWIITGVVVARAGARSS